MTKQPDGLDAKTQRRAVIAATIGNVLEIYDFIIFGIFAVAISKTFFPSGDEYAALMFTFMTFAAGFVVRPIGALVLGQYADKVGRKKALSFTLLLMALGTIVPAVCPSYDSIGIAATVILVLGRLLQGFSAGGEIGSNVAMLVENASGRNRALFSSFQQMAQGGGVLLGGIVGFAIAVVYGQQQMLQGYWRLAFVVGLVIGPVGWYIRRALPETPEFEHSVRQGPADSFLTGIKENFGRILIGIAIMIFWTVATQVSNYFTTYAVRELGMPVASTYVGQIASGLTLLLICPFVGMLADRIGPYKPMAWGAGLAGVLAYPLFKMLAATPTLPVLLMVQIAISITLGLYAACAPLVMSNIFPTRYRATGIGTSYALGVMIFGGLTPMIVTTLIQISGDKLIIGLYLTAAALLSLALIATLVRMQRKIAAA
ncbi:MFS transporter [Herbaspirillum sp. YR522]|uniref:MFS transporter n=1 Tax=Herbaspirillum sp. YR522 TaxID=1144342 RepID=UPI00026F5C52|nr:MFS transporter [Herbaspirillum sp. YR522]EJN08360.1 Major Facilitator Superfamily transporter [Herbaspirillum sp. YR522]